MPEDAEQPQAPAGHLEVPPDLSAGPTFPPWGWRECAAGLAAAIVGFVLLSIVASAIAARQRGGASSSSGLIIGLVATLVLELLLFGIAAGLTAGRLPGGLALLGWRARPPVQWIGWSALAVVMSWFAIGIYAIVTNLLGLKALQPHSNVPSDLFNHHETVALAVMFSVVTAPIAEETFFRGFLFNGLRRRLGFLGAAGVSGLIFAVVHATPTLIIPFTVVGVIFAYTYRRTGTLWASALAHATFNFVSVAFLLVGKG